MSFRWTETHKKLDLLDPYNIIYIVTFLQDFHVQMMLQKQQQKLWMLILDQVEKDLELVKLLIS